MPNFVGAVIAIRSFFLKTVVPKHLQHNSSSFISGKETHALTGMSSAWIFPGMRCSEKVRLSLGVFILLPALRDEQSTPVGPRWVYLVLLLSLEEDTESKTNKNEVV